MKVPIRLLGITAGAMCLHAQSVVQYLVGKPIPDGNSSGLADQQVVPSLPGRIVDLNVTLSISGIGAGAYNGDLYATLQHESGFVVLLNRSGRRTDNLLGYGDSGLDVTLDDSVMAPPISSYRLTLNGDHTIPLGGPLTGTWSTDGRNEDPDQVVLEASLPRTGLSAFVGLPAEGDWTLFVADLDMGGKARLDSWGLQITVPEPAHVGWAAGTVLLLWRVWLRRRPASGKQ